MSPTTEEEREQVRQLYAAGHGRNEISRRTGIHQRRVSRIAAEVGITFRRSVHTQPATEAKRADARARRAQLVEELLDDVDQLRRRLHRPYVVHQFDKEGSLNTGVLELPPARDQRDLMMAIGTALDKSVRLEEFDKDQGAQGARSMLGDLGRALGAAAAALAQDEPAPEDG